MKTLRVKHTAHVCVYTAKITLLTPLSRCHVVIKPHEDKLYFAWLAMAKTDSASPLRISTHKKRLKSIQATRSSRKRIHYVEIMIYVNCRKDVRLSKGWRYKPIMINALMRAHKAPPLPATHTQHVTRGPLWIPPYCSSSPCSFSPQHLSAMSTFSSSSDQMYFSILSRVTRLLLSFPCDLFSAEAGARTAHDGFQWCSALGEHRPRQSPLSWGCAICLCQTPPGHATWARRWISERRRRWRT